MRMSIVITLLACAIALSACGKKGPLYLPDEKRIEQTVHKNDQQHNTDPTLRLQPLQEAS